MKSLAAILMAAGIWLQRIGYRITPRVKKKSTGGDDA
jgi:hypothetical protein